MNEQGLRKAPEDLPANTQPHDARDRAGLILRILRGEITVEQASLDYGLAVADIEVWRQQFLAAGAEALAGLMPAGPVELTQDQESQRGVWVCSTSEDSLSSCLLLQAACPGSLSAEAAARWKGQGKPPRPLARSGSLALLHGAHLAWPHQSAIHLYANLAPDVRAFERHSDLADWELPVRLAALIVLVDATAERGSLARIAAGSAQKEDRVFSWIRRQPLPTIVAAMGYPSDQRTREKLRAEHGLEPEVPVVIGESPARTRLRTAHHHVPPADILRGSMATLFGMSEKTFDPEFAERIMEAVSSMTSSAP
jgi:hypothetical protein